jgi:hypothetical protein
MTQSKIPSGVEGEVSSSPTLPGVGIIYIYKNKHMVRNGS